MQNFKTLRQTLDHLEEAQLLEKLKASDPTGKWVSDFVDSDNPKFAGLSKRKRIQMALGASYAAKRAEGKIKEEAELYEEEGFSPRGHRDLATHHFNKAKELYQKADSAENRGDSYGADHLNDVAGKHAWAYHAHKEASTDPKKSAEAHKASREANDMIVDESVELEESKLTLDNVLSKGEQINDRIQKHMDAADFHRDHARKIDAKDPNDIEGYNRHASLTDLHAKAFWSLRHHKKSPNGNHLKDYVATHKRIQDRYKKEPQLTKEEVELEEAYNFPDGDIDAQIARHDKAQHNHLKRYVDARVKRTTEKRHPTDPTRIQKVPMGTVFPAKMDPHKNQSDEEKVHIDLHARHVSMRDALKHYKKSGDKNQLKYFKKEYGSTERQYAKHPWAGKKINEEVEELDELSKGTLASYAKKATHDARINHGIGKDFERISKSSRKPEYKQSAKEWEDKYKSDARRREAGVGKAIDRLAKEEVEHLDEISAEVAKRVAQARDRSAVANRLTLTQLRRLKMKDSGGEPFMNAAQALKSAMKRGAKNVYGEEVEIEEGITKDTGWKPAPKERKDEYGNPIKTQNVPKRLAKQGIPKQPVKEEQEDRPGIHKVSVTINHKDKDDQDTKIEKMLKVKANNQAAALAIAKKHYGGKGYKVHNASYHGIHEAGKLSSGAKDPCWKGYEMVGTKKKNGREVPNCVPKK